MARSRNKHTVLLLWVALLSQSLVPPALSEASVEDQKSFFPPISFSPPVSGSGGSPPVSGSGGGHATPIPTPTPSQGTPSQGTPSHGSSGSGHKPPTNCGSPPKGKKHHTSPSTPSGGGGGYHYSPPTSTPTPTPTTPISTPSPTTRTPPTTPVVVPGTPSTPGITTPAPPFSFGSVSPPFTCIFWRTHPTLIWGLIGWIGTVGSPLTGGTLGGTFGVPNLPGAGANMNVLQALSNPRTDGYGNLYREGTAAFLNSLAHARFPFTTTQVRDSFIGALASNKAAADQARAFRLANEGRSR